MDEDVPPLHKLCLQPDGLSIGAVFGTGDEAEELRNARRGMQRLQREFDAESARLEADFRNVTLARLRAQYEKDAKLGHAFRFTRNVYEFLTKQQKKYHEQVRDARLRHSQRMRKLRNGLEADLWQRTRSVALQFREDNSSLDTVKARLQAQGVADVDADSLSRWLGRLASDFAAGLVRRLHAAALANDVAAVRRQLADGVDVDARDGRGWTALMMAASQGHREVGQVLLFEGKADRTIETPNYENVYTVLKGDPTWIIVV